MKTMTLTEDEVSILRDAITAHYNNTTESLDQAENDVDKYELNEQANATESLLDRLKELSL